MGVESLLMARADHLQAVARGQSEVTGPEYEALVIFVHNL